MVNCCEAIYFFTNQSDYGLSELEKAQVIRMKENCLWADLGWLTVVTVGFLLLKAIYFILKGDPQAGDQVFLRKIQQQFLDSFFNHGIGRILLLCND